MWAGGLIPTAALFVGCVLTAFGQLPKSVEKCLPHPTLAQEVKDMQTVPPKVYVHVSSVEFDANSGIPSDAQEQISTELQNRTFEVDADADYMKDGANEIAKVGVRGSLQDRGYFRTTTGAKLTVLENRDTEISVAAAMRTAKRRKAPSRSGENHKSIWASGLCGYDSGAEL